MQFVTCGVESLSRRISLAGLASRRDAEKAILSGCVSVDGQTVRAGCKVADTSLVMFAGQCVPAPGADPLLFGCIKPRGVVGQTKSDQRHKETEETKPDSPVARFLSNDIMKHYIVVNKVPTMANGLVLLTTDSEFAKKLVSKHSKILTTVRIRTGPISDAQLDIARKWKTMGVLGPIWVELEKRSASQSWLKLRVLSNVDLKSDLTEFLWQRAQIRTNRINVVAVGPYTVNDVMDDKQITKLAIHQSIKHLATRTTPVAPTLIKKR